MRNSVERDPYYADHTTRILASRRRAIEGDRPGNCTHELGSEGPICIAIRPSMVNSVYSGDLGPGMVDCIRCLRVHSRL
jgi:hypothetical protein